MIFFLSRSSSLCRTPDTPELTVQTPCYSRAREDVSHVTTVSIALLHQEEAASQGSPSIFKLDKRFLSGRYKSSILADTAVSGCQRCVTFSFAT